MDSSLAFYKQCVKKLLSQYELLKDKDSEIELIFDDERMRYMVLWIGWHDYKRVHQCAVHIDISGDVIAIQLNDTEDLVATELVNMGIPKEKIILNFIHPKHRVYVEEEAAVVTARNT
jgi:hypothetical protein